MRSVSIAATLVLALGLACGGTPNATFNATIGDGASTEASTPSGDAKVTVSSAVTTPKAGAAGKEYPGTYLGVCQRMADCGCAPATTPKACAKMMEDAQKQSKAIAAQFGMKIDITVDEAMLFAGANASCDAVCSDDGSGGVATGGSVHINVGGTNVKSGANGASVTVGGPDAQIDMQVGPNGASIKITEDTDL